MPQHDPNNWFSAWFAGWNAMPEPVRAAVLAALVAFFRVIYDRKESAWIRRLLESVVCGLIGLVVGHLTLALGLSEGWGMFLGGMVGLYGADQVRAWGRTFTDRKIGGGKA